MHFLQERSSFLIVFLRGEGTEHWTVSILFKTNAGFYHLAKSENYVKFLLVRRTVFILAIFASFSPKLFFLYGYRKIIIKV